MDYWLIIGSPFTASHAYTPPPAPSPARIPPNDTTLNYVYTTYWYTTQWDNVLLLCEAVIYSVSGYSTAGSDSAGGKPGAHVWDPGRL